MHQGCFPAHRDQRQCERGSMERSGDSDRAQHFHAKNNEARGERNLKTVCGSTTSGRARWRRQARRRCPQSPHSDIVHASRRPGTGTFPSITRTLPPLRRPGEAEEGSLNVPGLLPHARASRLVPRSTHQDSAQPQAVPNATAGRGRCHGMDLQPSRKPGEYCSPTSSAVNFVEQRPASYQRPTTTSTKTARTVPGGALGFLRPDHGKSAQLSAAKALGLLRPRSRRTAPPRCRPKCLAMQSVAQGQATESGQLQRQDWRRVAAPRQR